MRRALTTTVHGGAIRAAGRRKKANRVSGTPFKLVKVSNLFKRFVSHENENRFESSSSPKREYYLSKAQALHDKGGDIDSVVSLLDKSIDASLDERDTVNPNNIDNLREIAYIRYRKGLILFEAERYDAALEAFNLAINVDENVKATYADLYYHRGLTHAYLGDQESAVSDFREAVRLDDQNFAAWLDLGRLLMHDEKFEEAIDCCNKALHIDPDNVQAWRDKARALVLAQRWEEGLDAYNQVLKRGKPDASLLLEKANALLELNRVEEALPVFDKAIKTSPRDTTGYIGKATALLSLPGRENEVIACYDQAIEIDHFNSSCWINRANVLYKVGRFAEALQSCDQAIELGVDPETSGAGKFKEIIRAKLAAQEKKD